MKNVSVNEPFFPGHFPKRPVFPGVLIMEALAQATGLLAFKTQGKKPDGSSLYYFAAIDNCRFKQPVQPGDQMFLEVKLLTTKRNIWKFSAPGMRVVAIGNRTLARARQAYAEANLQSGTAASKTGPGNQVLM